MMNENKQRELLEDTNLEEVTGGKVNLHGTIRQERGSTIYENPDGACYRMMRDGSWVFERKAY